jgi:hypothetical protein
MGAISVSADSKGLTILTFACASLLRGTPSVVFERVRIALIPNGLHVFSMWRSVERVQKRKEAKELEKKKAEEERERGSEVHRRAARGWDREFTTHGSMSYLLCKVVLLWYYVRILAIVNSNGHSTTKSKDRTNAETQRKRSQDLVGLVERLCLISWSDGVPKVARALTAL